MNNIYRLLALVRDVQALTRGPVPYGKRLVRKRAHRGLSRVLRDVGLTEHRR